ncbi:MAG: translation elongation factor-like protein [Candidatus Omnitrophota bacterium]
MVVKKRKVKKKAVKKKPAKKKTAKKKVVKKKAVNKKAKTPRKKQQEKPIGIVTHYFPHVRAAVIKLKAPLSVGEAIKIKGHTTDFIQQIDSLQIDRVPIQSAKKGQEIGLLVDSRVRQHDLVFKA